jgi:E3 ubiquitin-protein ligase UBR4
MIFKTLVLKPGSIQGDYDPATVEFFLNNPALMKNVESETNSNDLFLKSIQSSCLSGLYDDWQSGKTSFNDWKTRVEANVNPSTHVKLPHNWLLDCLLYSSSVRVQDMSRMIICCLAGSGLWSDCLYLMLELLPEALSICHQGADYYFTVLSKLLEDFQENHSLILEILLTETSKSVQDILAQQEKARTRGAFVVNISLGHGLACLLHLLTDLSENWGRHLLNNQKLANLIISSFLNVRKIQFVKNKVISESQEYLEKLFDHLHMDCSEDQRLNFLQECVQALIGINNDVLAQVFLVQQIIRVVEPTKPEPVYYMRLEKSMTQEEFIRGNIEKNPYSSTEIGPLMADVRKRICKDLELSDPDLLELLVAGQIISPNLKIHQVYENVHWPSVRPSNPKFVNKALNDLSPEELPQMVVTFRLAGLDGEATEDIVDTLSGDDLNCVDPELKYSITKTLTSGAFGFRPMQYLLELLNAGSQELTGSVLTLLFYSCQISGNRAALCQVGGVPVLLKMMNTSQKNTEQLLKILEKLISDPSVQPYISSTSDSISLILSLLKTHQSSLMEISPILPFLCQNNSEACSILVDYFKSHINISDLLHSNLPEAASHIENMLESLQASHSTLRDSFLASGVTKSLCEVFAMIEAHSRPEVTKFLLKILKGLVRSHYSSQQLLSPKVLEKIFKMKNDPNGIGPCAECLIEAVLQDREKANPAVADLLQIMTSNEDEQRRDKALKKKEEILKQFQIVSTFDMLLEEEEGLTCVICKEGYKLRPDDLLGFYIFVSSVPQNTSQGDLLHVMSLVTHFNAIHLQCHKEAARAEKSMRKPKTEWEGATIRNQHTKCNNWFPIWGPQIPKHDYASGLQWMFSSYSTVDSRFINEVYDLKLIIEKFAFEESFSRESRGGGPEHNMQAIPYLIQMIYFLMEEEKEQAEGFLAEIRESLGKSNGGKPQSLFLQLVAQMVAGNLNDWKSFRIDWIKRSWIVAKSFPRSDVKVVGMVNGVECSMEQKMVLSCFKAFLISFRIVDLVFNVLFAGNSDVNGWKVFLQSASEEIQERSLFIYEDYKRMTALQSIQDILSHLGTEFNISMFS